MAIELNGFAGDDPKSLRGKPLDDDVERYLGIYRYQSSIELLSLFWCDSCVESAAMWDVPLSLDFPEIDRK
jgi:hypothetical protein